MRKTKAEKTDRNRQIRREKVNPMSIPDELDILECYDCDAKMDLRFTQPEENGWKLVGFGVWRCPACYADFFKEWQKAQDESLLDEP